MTAKDKAFEAWMLSDLEAVASVIRARGEQNAEIVRTALRKAWDAGREAEREASEEYNKAYLDECAEMAKEAVESEREACPKIADLFEEKADALNDSIADDDDRNEGRSEYVMGKAAASSRIAAAIRARRES